MSAHIAPHASRPCQDADLAVRYGGTVPRYTSYPTAPHFSDAVDSQIYGRWLETVNPLQPVSLYLHVPFCKEMCWYCGCFTKIVKRYDPISDYVDLLCQETDQVAARLPVGMAVSHIHWGGGSPTILTPEDWRRVLFNIRERFDVANSAEIAVEIDPRTLSLDYASELSRLGVNRVSIGVQEFDEAIQASINRLQPYEVTKRVVDWLRDAGIEALNLDLMYGLPGQTLAHVERMTELALTLKPDRIALFGYAHVPWMKAHQRLIPEELLPGIEDRWHQATRASEILVREGYVRVGFDHFALPGDPMAVGHVGRNFQGYTGDDAETLIGLGASAIGSLSQGYVQNVASLPGYEKAVMAGDFATARGIALSPEDRLRRHVIESVLCDLEVDLIRACMAHGACAGTLDGALETLKPMQEDGLVTLEGRHLTVTERGRPLLRRVAAAFDTYLETGAARHSVGV